MAAIVNAMWDLHAKQAGKPLWKLLADMTPRQIVDVHRLHVHHRRADRGRGARDPRAAARDQGATASRSCCATAIPPTPRPPAGWATPTTRCASSAAKRSPTASPTSRSRSAPIRPTMRGASGWSAQEIGPDRYLMIDANQRWDVRRGHRARPRALARSTSCGSRSRPARTTCSGTRRSRAPWRRSASPRASIAPTACSSSSCSRRKAIAFCQIDSCRLGGVNENLAVILMAAKFGVPVCPHAGGVGLCELVQHLSMWDYLAVSGRMDDRVTEFVDHLHEHFVDPVVVRRGRYLAPTAPGYSSTIKRESREAYRYPGRAGVDGAPAAKGSIIVAMAWRPDAAELPVVRLRRSEPGSGPLGADPPRRHGLPVRGDALVGRRAGHGGGAGGARRGGRHRVGADGVPRGQRRLRPQPARRARGRDRRPGPVSPCSRGAPSSTQRTGGAFDVTSTPLSRCWGFLEREGRLPTDQEIADARAIVGMRTRASSTRRRARVRFARAGVEVNFGAIGKGFALDCMGDAAARARRAARAAVGRPQQRAGDRRQGARAGRSICGRAWRAAASDGCGSRTARSGTSGAGESFVEIDGQRYGEVDRSADGPSRRRRPRRERDHRRTRPPPTRCRRPSSSADRSWRAATATPHPNVLAVLVLDEPGERTEVFGRYNGATLEMLT